MLIKSIDFSHRFRQKSTSESEPARKKSEIIGQKLIETEKTETGNVSINLSESRFISRCVLQITFILIFMPSILG